MASETRLQNEWHNLLEMIMDSGKFKNEIESKGFFLSEEKRSFKEYCKEFLGRSFGTNTANYLSKDFWHHQAPILRDNNYYLIRTGKGSFAIFDEKRFPRPYLDLKIENPVMLNANEPEGFGDLKRAFEENILVNSALEQFNFNDGYNMIIERIFGKREKYYVGIRGNTTRKFDIYFQNVNQAEPVKIKEYEGQAELDYTLWTRNAVLIFEAKQIKDDPNSCLDIGWHKFAYAAIRFRNFVNLDVIPIYFLRTNYKTYFFVFPKFRFHNNGIILNDKYQMTPEYIFLFSGP